MRGRRQCKKSFVTIFLKVIFIELEQNAYIFKILCIGVAGVGGEGEGGSLQGHHLDFTSPEQHPPRVLEGPSFF